MRSAWCANAWARYTRWRWPPDRLRSGDSARCSIPIVAMAVRTRASSVASARRHSPRCAKRAMRTTSMARSGRMKLEARLWARYATRRGLAPGSRPRTRRRPACGRSRPTRVRSSVDLPEPLVPTSASDVPVSTRRSMPSTTMSPGYPTARPSAWTACSGAPAGSAPAVPLTCHRRGSWRAPTAATTTRGGTPRRRWRSRRARWRLPRRCPASSSPAGRDNCWPCPPRSR